MPHVINYVSTQHDVGRPITTHTTWFASACTPLMQQKCTISSWLWLWIEVCTSHSTQTRSFSRRSSQPISWLVLKKLNLTQLKQMCIQERKNTATQNKIKPGMVTSYDLRPGNAAGPILELPWPTCGHHLLMSWSLHKCRNEPAIAPWLPLPQWQTMSFHS